MKMYFSGTTCKTGDSMSSTDRNNRNFLITINYEQWIITVTIKEAAIEHQWKAGGLLVGALGDVGSGKWTTAPMVYLFYAYL
jgi:hypothetical protein